MANEERENTRRPVALPSPTDTMNIPTTTKFTPVTGSRKF